MDLWDLHRAAGGADEKQPCLSSIIFEEWAESPLAQKSPGQAVIAKNKQEHRSDFDKGENSLRVLPANRGRAALPFASFYPVSNASRVGIDEGTKRLH